MFSHWIIHWKNKNLSNLLLPWSQRQGSIRGQILLFSQCIIQGKNKNYSSHLLPCSKVQCSKRSLRFSFSRGIINVRTEDFGPLLLHFRGGAVGTGVSSKCLQEHILNNIKTLCKDITAISFMVFWLQKTNTKKYFLALIYSVWFPQKIFPTQSDRVLK